jgi:hypothetical protein
LPAAGTAPAVVPIRASRRSSQTLRKPVIQWP